MTNPLKLRGLLMVFLLSTASISQAQLLFPESFVVIFDTTKTFKGSFSPSLEIKTQKQRYLEITNRADMALRFGNHGFTMANKFELTKDGEETIISGGFFYGKFKTFYDNPFVLEHYVQYQWAEARGLGQKYAFGTNLRYKILKNEKGGVFLGAGPFYEFERWNFGGVPDERLPLETEDIVTRNLRLNIYSSTKRELSEKIKFEGAIYFQDDFQSLFSLPRFAGNAGFSYSFTENIAFAIQFRAIYDLDPVVPVDKLWFNTFSALEVTF